MTPTKTIRPGAELDFEIDWRAPPEEGGPWLATGETITSRQITLTGPLTKLSDSESDGAVTVWVRCDPTATPGTRCLLAVAITTNQGRKDPRQFELQVL